MKKLFIYFILYSFFVFQAGSGAQTKKFSFTCSKFLTNQDIKNKDGSIKNSYIWQATTNDPFTELIFSWNSLRPKKGKLLFYVSVKHNYWSGWYCAAEWTNNSQQTFVNTKNPFVHYKHVRLELAKKRKATAFRIKVVAQNGANLKKLKALFVNFSDMNKFCINKPKTDLETVRFKKINPQSQMTINHPRFRDFCSPTSLSMMINYFLGSEKIDDLKRYIPNFAKKVHDNSYLDIYGNWILNVAQAYDSTYGNVFFRVQRLNGFNELYYFLSKKIPVAVSVRGCLKGGAKPYNNGHFILVVGWDKNRQALLCIDSAFKTNKKTLRAYNVNNFLNAWGTSRNLSYIALPRKTVFRK